MNKCMRKTNNCTEIPSSAKNVYLNFQEIVPHTLQVLKPLLTNVVVEKTIQIGCYLKRSLHLLLLYLKL